MRPEGWEELRLGYRRVDISDEVYNAYEAGADAMLGVLKREGAYVEDSYEPIELCEHKPGWWVFIEDDE